jgi:hypothetical protein
VKREGWAFMGDKLRKLALAVLLAGSAAALFAAPAGAMREPKPTTSSTTEPSYVPPPKYGQNPHPVLPDEPDPYAGSTPPVVPVVLPQVITDPGSPASPGDQNAGDNSGRGVAPGDKVLGETENHSAAPSNGGGGFIGGVLSRTGANTLPLVRAGLAALTLGAGLLILARRRRAGGASA